MRRFFDSVNVVLVAGLALFTFWAGPHLPDQIPTHFGADGHPDAWAGKSSGSWLAIPGVAILLTLGIGWFRTILPSRPGWVNLPEKTKLTDLPEAARKPVLEMLSGFLALIQTEILVIFGLIQFGTFRTAMGQESQGIMITVLLIAILSSPLLLVVFFLRLQGSLERGKKLAAEMSNHPAPRR